MSMPLKSMDLATLLAGINNTFNVGGDVGLALPIVANEAPFRGLTAGQNITLSIIGDGSVQIDAAVDATTASNLGAGAGVFAQEVGNDLQFKSLVQNAEILITPSATELAFTIGAIAISKITGLQAALDTKIETITNVGTGAGLAKAKVAQNVDLKSLTEGSNITLTENADDVEIAATNTFVMGFNTDKKSNAANRFAGMFTNKADNNTESFAQSHLNFDFVIKAITIHIATNGVGAGGTDIVFRDNGVDVGATLINIPTGVTGKFSITGLNYTVNAGDLFNVRWQAIGGGGDVEDWSYMVECEKP